MTTQFGDRVVILCIGSPGRAVISIILPQASRIINPPLTNEVILLVKDSSLVDALGFTSVQYELTYLGRTAATVV